MPRVWNPRVGDTGKVGYDRYPDPNKSAPYNPDTKPAVPESTVPPTPDTESTPYTPPVDTYLRDKVNIDYFGNKQTVSTANANLPPIDTVHDSPDTDVFWNNPGRLARWYSTIKSAPQGWQPPSFIDPKAIESAYKGMEAANGYKDWTQWKPLATSDPMFAQLKGMALPPDEYLSANELRYKVQQGDYTDPQTPKPVDFNELPRWQQLLSYLTPAQEGFKDTPWLAKGTSAGMSGLLAGLGGAGITSMAIGAVGLIFGTVATGGALLAALPAIVGVGVGAASFYQSLSGKEIPVMGDVLQAFDFMSIAAEKGIGTGMQVADEGLQPFLQDYDKIKAAWKASEATYESAEVEVINVVAKILDFIDFNSNYFQVDAENLAKPGESWAFDYGLATPVKNTNQEGVKGLEDLRNNIQSMMAQGKTDQEIQDEVERFKASFYSSGGNNDLVFGTIIDPANWMPFITSKVGEYSTKNISPELSASFRNSAGSLFIDSLPFGFQQAASFLSNSFNWGLKESTGPLSALSEYKMRGRYKVDFSSPVMAKDLSDRTKASLGLTKEGKIAELEPAAAPRSGLMGRTLDLIDYLTGLTPDSKAYTLLNMFSENFSATILDPTMTDDQKIQMFQKAGGLKPIDMANVSELYLGSPAMVTVAEGYKYAMTNGSMDIYNQYKQAETTFLPWAREQAAAVDMSMEDMVKALGDPAKLKDMQTKLVNKGMVAKDAKAILKKLKDNFTGSNPIPITNEDMWVRFTNSMYEKMGEYVQKTYNITPENSIFRAFHIMKSVQNLMLLGFSPQYVLENSIGNKVSMAMTGVLGFMRPGDIKSLMSEMGIDPARIGEGYTPAGDITMGFHLASSKTKEMLAKEKRDIHNIRKGVTKDEKGNSHADAWAKVSSKVSGVTSIGVASSISAKIEAADSLQAYTAGLLRFYNSEFKRDRGLRRAPMEAMWDQKYPGLSDFIYSAIEHSRNIPQVYNKLFDTFGKPTLNDIIDYAAKQTAVDSDTLSQTLHSTGIAEAINQGLGKAKTFEEMNNVFKDVEDTLNQHATDAFIREINGSAEHRANKIKAEGVPAILRAHTLSETNKVEQMINDKARWDKIYADRNSSKITHTEFTDMVRKQFAREQEAWDRIYQQEVMLAKGIADAYGMDNTAADSYLLRIQQIQEAWSKFHGERRQLLESYFTDFKQNAFESKEDYKVRRNQAWEELDAAISMKFEDVRALENKLSAEADTFYVEAYKATTGWKPEVVKEWRVAVRTQRDKIYAMERDFRASLKGMDYNARQEAWKVFNQQRKVELFKLDQLEDEYGVRIMSGIPNADTKSPIIQSLVDAIQSSVNSNKADTETDLGSITDVLAQELSALGFDNAEIVKMDEEQMYTTLQQGIPSKVLNMLDVAKQLNEYKGFLNLSGLSLDTDPNYSPTKLLNIVNKYLGKPSAKNDTEGTRVKSLRDVSMTDFISAMKQYRENHKLAFILPSLKAKLFAEDIARISDQIQRENAIKQMGYHTREELKNYWQQTFKASDMEVEAALQVIDARAKQWGIERGYGDTEAVRDAFYATNFSTDTKARGASTLKQTIVEAASNNVKGIYRYIHQFAGKIETAASNIESNLDVLDNYYSFMIDPADDAEFNDPGDRLTRVMSELRIIMSNIGGSEDIKYNTTEGSFMRRNGRTLPIIETPIYKGTKFDINMYTLTTEDGVKQYMGIPYKDKLFLSDEDGNVRVEDINKLDYPSVILAYDENFDYAGYKAAGVHGYAKTETPFVPSLRYIERLSDKYTGGVEVKRYDNGTVIYRNEYQTVPIKIAGEEHSIHIKKRQNDFVYFRVDDSDQVYAAGPYGVAPTTDTAPTFIVKDAEGNEGDISQLQITDYKGTPSLIALHSLTVKKLNKAISTFGGPFSPSIAVTPFNLPKLFNDKGEDTAVFVMKKEAVTPGPNVQVHNLDSWSPTVPYNVTKLAEDKYRYTNQWDHTVETPLDELIRLTFTDTGHFYNDNYLAYQHMRANFLRGLVAKEFKSVDEMYTEAGKSTFEEYHSDLLNNFVQDPSLLLDVEHGTSIAMDMEINQRLKLDFIHMVATTALRTDPTDQQAVHEAIAKFLTSPLESNDNGKLQGTALQYATMETGPMDLDTAVTILYSKYRSIMDQIDLDSDTYFEAKYKGLLKPEAIQYLLLDSSKMNDPLITPIIQWAKDNGIPVQYTDLENKANIIGSLLDNNALFQKSTAKKGAAKGETEFLQDGRAIIRGLEAPDASTMMHELGHVFMQTLTYEDMNSVAKLGGLGDIREYYRLHGLFVSNSKELTVAERTKYVNFSEWFARGWEIYLTKGEAPTPELRSTFNKFTDWMLKIYSRLRQTGSNVSGFGHYGAFRQDGKEIDIKMSVNGVSLKEIFDKMLAGSEIERPPQYHELVQRAMTQIKTSEPHLTYRELMNKAQTKLSDMVFGYITEQLGSSLKDFMDSGETVYLPDGTPITGGLVQDMLNNGLVATRGIDTKLAKKDVLVNSNFVAGKPIAFKALGQVTSPAYEGRGTGLYAPDVHIPAKGLWVARIGGFEKDGTKYTAGVFYNGVQVAVIPDTFVGNTIDLHGRSVTVLGYDTTDQTSIVYKDGTVIKSMEIPATRNTLKAEAAEPDVVGDVPIGGVPDPAPLGTALHELRRDHIQPAIDAMRTYTRDNWDAKQKIKYSDVDPDTQQQIKEWIDSDVSADMGQVKRLASKYGEMRRDEALVDYNRRYGVDEILGLGWPYEMWYTRMLWNWAKKIIDKPSWYAMYARIERQRRRFENEYLPDRLKGTVRLPAPWLPDWAGGSVYSDPFRRIFQFSSMFQPLQQFGGLASQQEYVARDILSDMVKSGEITDLQKQDALSSKQGDIWNKAFAQAQQQSANDMTPLNMANMMMTPAVWWTTPYYIGTNQKDKITTTPGYRVTQAVKNWGSGTVLEPMTDVIGMLGEPEAQVRQKVLGLDEPTSMFGQYGRYYVNREIANMAIDSNISATDAANAVAQQSGPIWEQAVQRVMYQQSLKIPGGLGMQSIKAGANPLEVIGAFVAGTFPNSVFPKGEKEYANIRNQLSMAYDKKNKGDANAVKKFYKDYPVYSLRTLIKESDPKEQLRMVLVNEIWQKYNELGGANKRQVRRYLGSEFDNFVTNKEAQDMATIEQLSEWASGLGAETPSNAPTPQQPASIPYFSAEQDKAYDDYINWKNTSFPKWYEESSAYYKLPVGPKRTAFLNTHPNLRKYFDENRRYKTTHPEVKKIQDEINSDGGWYEDAMNSFNSSMKTQLHNFQLGKPLGDGTVESLRKLYNRTGRNSGLKFEDWIQVVSAGILK